MAIPLSSYFNWENSFQTPLNDPEMSSYCPFFHEQTPAPDFSDHHEGFFLINDNNANNLLFDCYDSFPAELTYPPPLPQCQCPQTPSPPLSHYDNNINIFPGCDDYQTFHCPYTKRRKSGFENNYYFCDRANLNPFSSNSCLVPEFNYDIGVPPQKLPAAEERTVSAQSVAARERRKKIAEKIDELGKMVPGGNKMNTADMLLAASKYVKYLQAQVSMLQLMNNTPTEDNEIEYLQVMLGSESVEEKLYSQEKCLVPQHLITTLNNHADFQTKPSILKHLNQPEKKQL